MSSTGGGGRRGQKLELTWVGKEERPRLEPRILVEDPTLSHAASIRREGDLFDNRLIQGDNLLALKSLEAEFAGKIKCIYIDPPFNTQQEMEFYEDGVEHSIWLSMIQQRLQMMKELMSSDGTLFIHIDDNELAYLILLADQIFGRSNRCYIISFKQASATGHKAINPGCVSVTNYILIYAKNKQEWKPNRVFTARARDTRYNQFIENIEAAHNEWQTCTLIDAFAAFAGCSVKEARQRIKASPELLDDFVLDHAKSVIQWARPDYENVAKSTQTIIDASEANPSVMYRIEREGLQDLYLKNGMRALFYADKLRVVDGAQVASEPLTTLWDDILSNNIHKEGGVTFPKGKKPEALIKRCLELASAPGDLVLDSFAGSGTTGAVAHKMGRRWILVEQGEHAKTHIVPRLKQVIEANDKSGVTEATGWQGGGGFRFYRLAPSLLEKDRWGNWVISKEYNPAMLAEAMCKHMSFTYAPSQDPLEYWQHGHSSERDFIFVTTHALTHKMLEAISYDVGPDRHLLICCKAFSTARSDAFANLTLTKIPHAILSTCEWGRDDYSLRVATLPEAEPQSPVDGGDTVPERKVARKKRIGSDGPTLFDAPADAEG